MRWAVLVLAMPLLLVACDGGATVEADALVVEAFFDVGQPLPDVIVRRTASLDGAYPGDEATVVSDALLEVTADDVAIPYAPVPNQPGRYRPVAPEMVRSGVRYQVEVRWQQEVATAETRTPPRLVLDSLRAFPYSTPVRAVLLDSLRFDTLGTGAQEGYVYPVEVVAWWAQDGFSGDSLWLRSQLLPAQPVSSTVVDLFFPPERIVEERTLGLDGQGGRVWRGWYAVPVEGAASPLPPHRLRVALVRSGRDYARFAATRSAPGRREPIGNVTGGLGIVAGVSVDSLTLEVR